MTSGALLDQHTLSRFTAIGFSFHFYESEYHVQRNDALTGGVLCDSFLYFVIRVTNKLESVFGSPNRVSNKTYFHGFGASLNKSSVEYSLCCGIVHL